MERVLIVDRKGRNLSFIGAGAYHIKASWAFGVTLFADGRPVGFFWRPLSISVGLASPDEIRTFNENREKHEAAMLGVKL